MSFIIRAERPADFAHIREVVRLAFEHAEHSDADEHFLVERLRASPEYIPELSLVAEEEGHIVGHIMFSIVHVEDATALALAPLSVLPAHQNKGIGSAAYKARARGRKGLGLGYCDPYRSRGLLPALWL